MYDTTCTRDRRRRKEDNKEDTSPSVFISLPLQYLLVSSINRQDQGRQPKGGRHQQGDRRWNTPHRVGQGHDQKPESGIWYVGQCPEVKIQNNLIINDGFKKEAINKIGMAKDTRATINTVLPMLTAAMCRKIEPLTTQLCTKLPKFKPTLHFPLSFIPSANPFKLHLANRRRRTCTSTKSQKQIFPSSEPLTT